MLALLLYRGRCLTPFQILLLGAWSSFFCVCFLPCMHDRYAFLPDMLLLVLAFVSYKKSAVICAVTEIVVSLLSWLFCLEFPYQPIPMPALALVRLSCLVWLTLRLWYVLKRPEKDKPLELEPLYSLSE